MDVKCIKHYGGVIPYMTQTGWSSFAKEHWINWLGVRFSRLFFSKNYSTFCSWLLFSPKNLKRAQNVVVFDAVLPFDFCIRAVTWFPSFILLCHLLFKYSNLCVHAPSGVECPNCPIFVKLNIEFGLLALVIRLYWNCAYHIESGSTQGKKKPSWSLTRTYFLPQIVNIFNPLLFSTLVGCFISPSYL